MNITSISKIGIFALSLTLLACNDTSGEADNNNSGSNNEATNSSNTNTGNTSDNSGNSDNSDNSDNVQTPIVLSDMTWSAGQDQILGLSFTGTATTPIITTLKGAPVNGQAGDLYSIRSATYPATELAEIKSIDNGSNSYDFSDVETISAHNTNYVIACQDGLSNYSSPVSTKLHLFKMSDPSKSVAIEAGPWDERSTICSDMTAEFVSGGAADAMTAKVYVAGQGYFNSGGSVDIKPALLGFDLTIDTTKDVDETDAVLLSSTKTLATSDVYYDKFSGVAASGTDVYFFKMLNSSSGGDKNSINYVDASAASPTALTISDTGYNLFAGYTREEMPIADMFVVPSEGVNDYDIIYMVSDSNAPGIVTAGFNTTYSENTNMVLSTNTDTLNCSDVITGVKDGSSNLIWCNDSTEAGKITEVLSFNSQD